MPTATIEREDEIVIHYTPLGIGASASTPQAAHLIPKPNETIYYSSNPREVTCPVCLRAIRELDR